MICINGQYQLKSKHYSVLGTFV